ncbi:MAG: endo alpha-1,4 polygalactosaminidase [Hyphomicrobiaceae bacterium]
MFARGSLGVLRAILALGLALGLAGAACGPSAARDAGKARVSGTAATPATAAEAGRLRRLAAVKSWGYQLRLIRFPAIAASSFDLVVIDHALSAGRRFVHQFAPELIEMAKRRPDGRRRIVLAYMSIGEAERYRFYWDQAWYDPRHKPRWLGDINPVWDGNYLARFWDRDWQRIILEGPDSYLGRIMAAGFDGIYLDRADVHAEWAKERKSAEADMVRFIARIGEAARARNPDFLVVMQNAEELLRHAFVVRAIDAVAKEDLFFGVDHRQGRNDTDTVSWSLRYLRQAKRAGRQVFVVEYLDDARHMREVEARLRKDDFVAHFTARDLGDLADLAERPAAPGIAPAGPPGTR